MPETRNANRRSRWKLIAYYALPALLIILFVVQPNLPGETGRTIVANVFLGIILALLITLMVVFVRRFFKELGYGSREYRIVGISMLVLLVAGTLFFFLYFRGERDIKVYDFSAYWIRVLEARGMAADSLTELFRSTISSLSSDYTYVAALPLVPLSYLFGTQYFGYVLSIFFAYLLPACLFLSLYAMRLVRKAREQSPSVVTLVACTVFGAVFPGMLWPIMNGYLDVCGVLIIALMLNVTLHWNGSVFSWKHIAALTALSVLLLLARRWYAYYIVGFYLGLAVDLIFSMIRRRRFSLVAVRNFVLNMGLIAAISSAFILIVNRSVFTAFFGVDYSSAYSMAKTVPWWENLWQIVQTWGFLWLIAVAAGMVILLRKRASRPLSIRLIVASAVAFALFSTVQNLDMHHFYLVTPFALVFSFAFVDATVRFMQREKAPVFSAALAVVGAVNFTVAFVPAAQGLYPVTYPFTTSVQLYPKVYEYYDTVREIADDLSEKVEGTSSLVYVVGSNETLSSELLKRIDLPRMTDSAPYVMYNHISDLRDGFPSHLFIADYILLNDPFIPTYETVQQVSYQVYDMLMNDPQASRYYERTETYREGTDSILVFRRVLPADTLLIDDLEDRLATYYPDDPYVWEPNYLIALFEYDRSSEMTYDYWAKNFIFRHDGRRPTEMGWNDTAGFTTLQFQMQTRSTAMDLIVENQNSVLLNAELEENMWENFEIDITDSEYITVRVIPLGGSQDTNLEFAIDFNGKTMR